MKPKDDDLKIIITTEIRDKKYHAAIYLEKGHQTKKDFMEIGESMLLATIRKLCEEEIIKT